MEAIPRLNLKNRLRMEGLHVRFERGHDGRSFFRWSSVIIAVMLFAAYYLGRVGLGDVPNVLPLFLSITILLLPDAFGMQNPGEAALFQLGVIVFFFFVGWISILGNIDLSIVVYAGFVTSIFVFFKKRGFSLGTWVGVKVVLTILFGFELVSLVWTPDYMNPLSPESFAVGRRFVHVDTLFLSTLTSNIKTYQEVTTGLSGLVPFRYHAGSNFLFASYAQLCKLSALQFYNFAYPVIFIPLFYQSILFASMSKFRSASQDIRVITSLLVLFLLLSGFFPMSIGSRFLLPTALNHHFISQSYCISLIYCFLAMTTYRPLLKRDFLHRNRAINTALFLSVPLWVLIIGYTKVSTAVVLLTVFLYLLLRRRLLFKPQVFVSAVLALLTLWWVLTASIESNENTFLIQWGSYYNMYVKGNIILYFLLQYIFLIFLVVTIVVVTNRRQRVRLIHLATGRYLLIELVGVATVVGLVPGLLIHIEGGSAYYFSDVQYWLTAIALMNVVPFVVYATYRRRTNYRRAAAIAAFLLAVFIVRESFFRSFYYFIKKNVQIRTALAYGRGASFKNLRATLPLGLLLSTITIDIRKSPEFQTQMRKLNLALFDSLRDLSPKTRSRSVIYCKDLSELEKFLTCAEATFYVPTMAEMSMINGLYWAEECYTIGAYGMRAYPAIRAILTKEEAIDLARSKNYTYLIELRLSEQSFSMIKLGMSVARSSTCEK